ncbi:MAG: thiamine-phosphate kinase, partial [Candidatus Omnitrophica bacterium]|nr:thiamine-phosphate kinase [Candidatus Omnitrophota bacterium]
MTIQQNNFSEFDLIKRFRRKITTDATVFKGSGDDCAVLNFDRKHYQLFTCDMLVQGVDFTVDTDLKLVGRKALAVSISDIASCAGLPRQAVISLGLPKTMSLKQIDRLAAGFFALAKDYKINIVGGDISSSQKLVIDVSMLGIVEKNNLCLRQGAKNNDLIFVSGALGGSISGKHLKFTPRLKEARFLTAHAKINAMIDISDGLAQDLGHILEASGKGALLYEEFIPQSRSSRGISDALYSGEDFELLFTLSPSEAKKISQAKGFNFRRIGYITKESGLKMVKKNKLVTLLALKGFD